MSWTSTKKEEKSSSQSSQERKDEKEKESQTQQQEKEAAEEKEKDELWDDVVLKPTSLLSRKKTYIPKKRKTSDDNEKKDEGSDDEEGKKDQQPLLKRIKRSQIPSSALPGAIVEAGEEELSSRVLFSKSKKRRVVIPDNMIDATANAQSFQELKQFFESVKPEKTSQLINNNQDYATAAIGIIYSFDKSNFFAPPASDIQGKSENELSEDVAGVAIVPAKSSKGYFIPLFIEEAEADSEKEKSKEKNVGAPTLDERWTFLLDLMGSKHHKVCYDAQFLLKAFFCKKSDLIVQNVEDVFVGSWLIDPELQSFQFPDLMYYFLQVRYQIPAQSKSNKSKSKKELMSPVHRSLFHDLLFVLRLFSQIKSQLTKLELMYSFTEVESKVAPILAEMELRGIQFNEQELDQHRTALQEYSNELEKEAEKVIGRSVKLSSNKKMASLLFDELSLQKLRDSEKSSTSEASIKHLKEVHPIVPIVLEYRHTNKILSTYIENLLRSSSKGTVHTKWNITTATGRISSSYPNLQSLPRGAMILNYGPLNRSFSINIRNAFVAREGKVLVAADYSQIEMRVLAHLSKDPMMLEFFNSGKDVHTLIASRWLDKAVEDVTTEERERAKQVVYGIVYGIGPNSLSEILEVEPSEAKAFIDSLLEKFPGVRQFLDEAVNEVKAEGKVRTLMKRIRYLTAFQQQARDQKAMNKACRQAINTKVQGTAADMVKLAMIHVQEKLVQSNHNDIALLMQIHDELVFEVSEDKLPTLAKQIKEVMESVIQLQIATPVTIKSGKKLGTMLSLSLTEPPTSSTAGETTAALV